MRFTVKGIERSGKEHIVTRACISGVSLPVTRRHEGAPANAEGAMAGFHPLKTLRPMSAFDPWWRLYDLCRPV